MKKIKIKPDDERTIPEVLEEFTLLKESENIAPKTIHNYVQSIGKFQNETGVGASALASILFPYSWTKVINLRAHFFIYIWTKVIK